MSDELIGDSPKQSVIPDTVVENTHEATQGNNESAMPSEAEENAVAETTIEEQANGATSNGVGNAQDDEDDDFGDFSDASFDDFEEPQAAPEPSSPTIEGTETNPTIGQESEFPQSLFQDANALDTRINALCHEAFPRELEKFTIPSNTSILNERSEHLLERLVTPPYLKPYNWKKGSLRRQLLVTLGLPEDVVVQRVRNNEFDMTSYVAKKLEELSINADEKKKLLDITDEEVVRLQAHVLGEDELTGMDEEQLDSAIAQLQQAVGDVEKLVSVWEDEKNRLEEDHRTYESVVENLVGHTQRLQREEALRALKKGKERKLGLFRRKTTR